MASRGSFSSCWPPVPPPRRRRAAPAATSASPPTAASSRRRARPTSSTRRRSPSPRRSHASRLRNAAADLPEEVDLGDWEGPVVKILKITGLDVDLYQGNYEDTDAILLDSDVSLYDLKDDLFAVDFEYVRSVGGKDGVDRYVHVINTNAEGANVIRSAQAICTKYGFASDADFADVDASAW